MTSIFRFLTLACALALALGLSACGDGDLAEGTAELKTTAFGDYNSLERFYSGSNHFYKLQPLGASRGTTDATFEGSLGLVRTYASAEGGDKKVYACKAGGDDFTAPSSDCESQTRGSPDNDFFVHSSDGDNRLPLYRCLVTSNVDHFLTLESSCEGQTNEGVIGYINTRKVVPEGVIKTSLGAFDARQNADEDFQTPPWVDAPPGPSGELDGYFDGFLIPDQDFVGYDGYEARCQGAFYSKKRIVWQNVTTDTTVATSSRRVSGQGRLESSIGPTQSVQPTQNYRFAIYPDGIINPPPEISSVYSCEIFGLDFR